MSFLGSGPDQGFCELFTGVLPHTPSPQLCVLDPVHPCCLQLLEMKHSSWGSMLFPRTPQHGALFLV